MFYFFFFIFLFLHDFLKSMQYKYDRVCNQFMHNYPLHSPNAVFHDIIVLLVLFEFTNIYTVMFHAEVIYEKSESIVTLAFSDFVICEKMVQKNARKAM